MIRIGLKADQKQTVIDDYINKHNIGAVYTFAPDAFPLLATFPVPVESYSYNDIIEYKPFYHLLEVIDSNSLLIFSECMRTQKRSDLTYNCAHHYCNQTPHKIVFEHFPFIQDSSDFMILLDLIDKVRFKGKAYADRYLSDIDIAAQPISITLNTIDLLMDIKQLSAYEKKKTQLFDGLGQSDPDTIPRSLHIFAGGFKKSAIDPSLRYVARNDRFKLRNVTTYKTIVPGDYIVIDFPHRRIDFNDFLKKTGMNIVNFVNSGLKVDQYYINDLQAWNERLGEFYAKASLFA